MGARRWMSVALMVAGTSVPATNAYALWDDRLELFAFESVTHDDNVFRISSAVDPTSVLGTSTVDDTFYTTSVGLNFDVPVSRQRFTGGYARNYTRYNRFKVLDLDGYDGHALWSWQLGNELNGELGYVQRLTLASLANVQSGVQSVTPDFLKASRAFFNATYKLTARWQVRGEASWGEQSNSAGERKVNDIRLNGSDVTVSYVTPAETQFGINLVVADANLPNPEATSGVLIDNSYRQHDIGAVMQWTPTGHSRLKLRAGQVTRNFDQLPQRNFKGPTFFAGYEWKPTGKLRFIAVAERNISSTEEVNVAFVLIKRIALYPSWQATAKTSIDVGLEQADRDYRGDPGLVLGTVAPLTETVRAASLAVTYRAAHNVTLNLAVRRETRSSSAAFGDYEANIVGVGIRLGI